MSAGPGNVRPLRPMRMLLVSDDLAFTVSVLEAGDRHGLPIACASADDDLDMTLIRHAPNLVVFDADDALRRATRSATAFVARHPEIKVVLLTDGAAKPRVSGIDLLDRRTSPDRLLSQIELAYLGVDRSPRSNL